ncbi:hypothetical protein LPMP_231070 [Leishmania panamensis]|uniref:Transmembrane protein n=7 Tax=Viannia TaxID=37616 RepID=A4HCW3_LEIBR|nr:conserved hypothetical protein [Leishmania braziliensis MHOM/BR/75/M2904]XP_010699264.1 hypothetical protein LPMP_231070 [Leishmania panamensis]KAI5688530.1 hypothetical protein MNV84_04004 [Leishmania braziliensis]CCM15828.1 hypothetical protein, conserved [Leishmania guyanensis]AIN98557.1 hypothetical protein LPMP_231070 [Leishmania panamensis]CAJ2473236.1 unnamed protein product [Leishmania braziliensis]CAJ2473774.1 unnamed protein product [Leishmania braziliensis]
MFSPSVLLRSRIPDTGHHTTATFKWATYTFWYFLDPALRRHHWYYRRKVQLDRFLERNSIATNSLIGVIFGVTVYFSVICGALLPPAVGAKEHSMKENAREVLNLMECDTSKELPAYQLMRVKREIIGKLHAVADEAEVRRQREEAEKLSELLKSLS